MSGNKHFDCLKNTLPDNWTNSNATGYYNRAFWKRCKCEYGPHNPCKETADKWNPVATEPSKWTKGCSKCSSYYNSPANFYYSYNPEDCGDCKRKPFCPPPHVPCDPCSHKPCDPCKPCLKCPPALECECRKGDKWSFFCDKCKKHERRVECADDDKKNPLKSYVYNAKCGDCQDVAIVYKMVNEQYDCDNIVELKVPIGGSKEKYLASHFPPEFIEANRFQCATVPVYNSYPNNVIDNMRQELFTESDQAALVKRGIRNTIFAQQLMDEGKLIHEKQSFQIPMSAYGKTSYYYFGDTINSSSTQTGLVPEDAFKGYFKNLN